MIVRLTTRTAYAPNGIKADKQVHTQKSKEEQQWYRILTFSYGEIKYRIEKLDDSWFNAIPFWIFVRRQLTKMHTASMANKACFVRLRSRLCLPSKPSPFSIPVTRLFISFPVMFETASLCMIIFSIRGFRSYGFIKQSVSLYLFFSHKSEIKIFFNHILELMRG